MRKDLKRKLSWFMSAENCPYSGLAITHQETLVGSDPKTNYSADIAKLGKNILLLKPYGFSTALTGAELVKFIDDFIGNYFKSESGFVLIEDCVAITGATAESRKKYINYFKNNDFLIALLLYQLPPILKISFNLAKKLHLYAERAHAVGNYEQAIDFAQKLIGQNKNHNKKPSWFMTADKCACSGLPISHPEAFFCSDPAIDFHADIARLGKNILLVKSYGYVTSFAESEFLAFIDAFTKKYFKSANGIIFIEDYADLTGGDADSRKKYITYFSSNHLFIACILYNLPPIYKLSVNLAKKLHLSAARAHAVNSYEQAVDLALKLTGPRNCSDRTDTAKTVLPPGVENRFSDDSMGSSLFGLFRRISVRLKEGNIFFTEKTRQQLAKKYSDDLIRFIASIDWQTPGLPPADNRLEDDMSSKNVFDAISFVKSEIDTLMAERAAVEAVVRESEVRYRLLVEHAKAGILEYDYASNRITSVNDEFVHMTGFSEKELLAMDPTMLFTAESRKMFLERLAKINAGIPVSQDAVYQTVTRNNENRWWLLNSNVDYQNGRPAKASAVITDITKIKQSENKLMEYQEKLKRLSIRLSMAEEEQRRAMASHLHETIGQELFVMQMQLNVFEKSIADPALLTSLQQIREQLLKIIKETKNLTFDLSPPVLYDFGFPEALKTLSETIEFKHNIKVQTCFEGEMDAFDNDIKVILYRNIKELIHNAVKHADAGNLTICLKNSSSGLIVELTDDGIGFNAEDYIRENTAHEGFGLFDIREKLNHLGGSLHIRSAPGQGTSVVMEVPASLRN